MCNQSAMVSKGVLLSLPFCRSLCQSRRRKYTRVLKVLALRSMNSACVHGFGTRRKGILLRVDFQEVEVVILSRYGDDSICVSVQRNA